jgi:hypothetical protein
VSGTVTYRGNPLEAAYLIVQGAAGGQYQGLSNAYGQVTVCLPSGAGSSLTTFAEMSSPDTGPYFLAPNMAVSPTYACLTAGNTCSLTASSIGVAASASASVSIGGCLFSARLLSAHPTRTKVRAKINCKGFRPTSKTRIWIKLKGDKHLYSWGYVTFSKGKWHDFWVKAKLKQGDHVELSSPKNVKQHLPALKVTLTVIKKLIKR